MNKKSRGFTLIELLVVIAIIGVLAGVVLSSLNSARAKGRDSRRDLDTHQIHNALALYYDDFGKYPDSIGSINSNNTTEWEALGVELAPYIGNLPSDPLNDSDYYYAYEATDVLSTDYTLSAIYEARITETPNATFIESDVLTHSSATYSVTSANLGAESATRRVYVVGGGTAFRSIVSATIGGVPATILEDTLSGTGWVFAITALVPTGTTGDIVLNVSGTTFTDVLYAVYTADSSLINGETVSSSAIATNNTTVSVTLPEVADGSLIAVVGFAGATPKSPQSIIDVTADASYNPALLMIGHRNGISTTNSSAIETANWTGSANAAFVVLTLTPY